MGAVLDTGCSWLGPLAVAGALFLEASRSLGAGYPGVGGLGEQGGGAGGGRSFPQWNSEQIRAARVAGNSAVSFVACDGPCCSPPWGPRNATHTVLEGWPLHWARLHQSACHRAPVERGNCFMLSQGPRRKRVRAGRRARQGVLGYRSQSGLFGEQQAPPREDLGVPAARLVISLVTRAGWDCSG